MLVCTIGNFFDTAITSLIIGGVVGFIAGLAIAHRR